MKKLVSLAERPATENDVGKTVYRCQYNEITEGEIILFGEGKPIYNGRLAIKDKNKNDDIYTYLDNWLWQPVNLVSEEYLKELEANQVAGRCGECKNCHTTKYLDPRYDCFDNTPNPEDFIDIFTCMRNKEEKSLDGYCSEFEPKDKGEL